LYLNPVWDQNPAMIQKYLLTTFSRSQAPVAWLLEGVVRPGARMFGDTIAGGRAP